MPRRLSKFFGASSAAASKRKPSDAHGATPSLELTTLKELVRPHLYRKSPSSLKNLKAASSTPDFSSSSSGASTQVLKWLRKAASKKAEVPLAPAQNSAVEISREISSILHGNEETNISSEPGDRMLPKNILDIPWFSSTSNTCAAQRRKEVSRERKQKYIFKNTESRRFTKLMRMCADKLGTESTIEVFGKLGRETGIKEYNALIKLCIDKARQSTKEEGSSVQIRRAYQLFISMREHGFQIEEESYGPFLMYMIDMRMIEEFQIFSGIIRDDNPESCSRLGYYEMLLWIRVGDEDKIQELCNCIVPMNNEDSYNLAESYLLAFCESDRKVELLQLLEVLDISKISSLSYVSSIFKSLGRLRLEKFAEKFVLALKKTEAGDENISFFIYDYAISIPNLAVEEVVSTFRTLHEELGVLPSIMSYNKMIRFCCNLFKVRAALDVAENMCESGLNVPNETLHLILHDSEENCELDLVHPIFSMVRRFNLRPKGDTFRSMICLYVKMKDFQGAYNLLTYAEEINEMPTAGMYNAIMAGYFREKDIHGALMVLNKMQDADVKPDPETFSYLIANSECEKDVIKYRDEMQLAGIQVTKHVYMAMINAYANFGKFEMAKQVVSDQNIPAKFSNEIKSVLVSALASHSQVSDALNLYDEIKQAGCTVEPKAVISLIEHLRSDGELDRLLQLLKDLRDSSNWFDGCSRVILYCVRHNLASPAVGLLKQLKEKDESSTNIVLDQIFGQLWETEPANLQIGLKLLCAITEELDLHPSRTSLDFLLSTCAKARDQHSAQLIWSEYKKAALPYNVLTFLRMYQVLLVSGDQKAASKMLKRIPKEDPHIRYIIKSCEMTFENLSSVNEKKN